LIKFIIFLFLLAECRTLM